MDHSNRRWIYYLIVNVIVSALTTLLVLTLWEAARGNSVRPPTSALTAVAAATLPPVDEPTLQIANVFGVGDVEREVVLINRLGAGELNLKGWKLKDENGHSYFFPSLTLNPDGSVQVYTRAGSDSVTALYWNQQHAFWTHGELVTIFDPAGNLRTTYRIP